jgi:hypothetical protein
MTLGPADGAELGALLTICLANGVLLKVGPADRAELGELLTLGAEDGAELSALLKLGLVECAKQLDCLGKIKQSTSCCIRGLRVSKFRSKESQIKLLLNE